MPSDGAGPAWRCGGEDMSERAEGPQKAREVVEGALAYARFQAHGSFERFAKFYGENLGHELGDRARKAAFRSAVGEGEK